MQLYLFTTAPRVRHLEDLSEVEQRLFYTRVLCTNFNFLYQNLNTPAILEVLEERGLIDHYGRKEIDTYSEKYAQNTFAVQYMQHITAPPNCMEKLCEILNQDYIAKKLFSGKTLPIHANIFSNMEIIQFSGRVKE